MESEGFINLVCSFTIPKNTKVKPYANFCTTVPPSCFASRTLQETSTRGSKWFISNLLPSSLPSSPASQIISVHSFPLWPHCNLTSFTVPCVSPTLTPLSYSLPFLYKQSQLYDISDIRRLLWWTIFTLVTSTHLHSLPKTTSFSRLISHKKLLDASLKTQPSKAISKSA